MKLFHQLAPVLSWVIFESEGGSSEVFLTQCLRDCFSVTEVEATPFGFRARVPARQYRLLHPLARRCHCHLRIRKKGGLGFRTKVLKRHKGVLTGLALAVLLFTLAQNLVWNITYYNIPSDQQQLLGDRLFSYGVYQGARVTDELLQRAKQQILIDTKDYAWLSLNFAKGKLTVEGQMASAPPRFYRAENGDILAAESGVVRSVEVYDGFGMVQPGQLVKKGDVLVSTTSTQSRTGQVMTASCRAKVTAYVECRFVACCPLQQTGEEVVKARLCSRALCFGGRMLWLKKPDGTANAAAQKGVSFLGLSLPLTVYETTELQKEPVTVTLDRAAAEKKGMETVTKLMYAQYPDIRLLSRKYDYRETEQGLECTLSVTAYLDIARSDIVA